MIKNFQTNYIQCTTLTTKSTKDVWYNLCIAVKKQAYIDKTKIENRIKKGVKISNNSKDEYYSACYFLGLKPII